MNKTRLIQIFLLKLGWYALCVAGMDKCALIDSWSRINTRVESSGSVSYIFSLLYTVWVPIISHHAFI